MVAVSLIIDVCLVMGRLLLSGLNNVNDDLAELDHRLLTYLAIFHTMSVLALNSSRVTVPLLVLLL